MSNNMPILWQNALMQYQTCPIAAKAWVWFAETRSTCAMSYDADRYANEVQHLVTLCRPMLKAANKPHHASDEVMNDLLHFVLRRHANYRLGFNVRPTFLEVAA